MYRDFDGRLISAIYFLLLTLIPEIVSAQTTSETPIEVAYRLRNENAVDQDDHCIWYNQAAHCESRILCSDKSANKVFVYNLRGELKQSIEISKPGNIDCRHNVRGTNGGDFDIVIVNERESRPSLHAFIVDRQHGTLKKLGEPVDTGENYGGCLFYDKSKSILYAFTTSKSGVIEQYRLVIDSDFKMMGEKVRSWKIGYCEGAVAEDETGYVYIAEENGAVWRFLGAPTGSIPGEKLCSIGELGLVGNLEGLALLKHPKTSQSLLVVSDQGRNRIVFLSTTAPATKFLDISIEGGIHTDGIEIMQRDLGGLFPSGLLIAHTDSDEKQPLVVDLKKILQRLER